MSVIKSCACTAERKLSIDRCQTDLWAPGWIMSRSRVKPSVRLIYWLSILLFAITLVPAPQVARAQDANCRPDVEPNNTEAEIEKVDSSFCVSGDLPDSGTPDQ